jgi:hypothetical protein
MVHMRASPNVLVSLSRAIDLALHLRLCPTVNPVAWTPRVVQMAKASVNFDSSRSFPVGGNKTTIQRQGACMQFGLLTADGRLFDFDVWDWSMILGGSLLVCLIALLV